MMRNPLIVVRLVCGIGLAGYGIVLAIVETLDGQSGRALASGVIWGLLGVLVAPLAEDIEDEVRRMLASKDRK